MTLQGGDDFFRYRPFEPEGESNTIGFHRGTHESLNITNPQPGYKYYYVRNDANSIVRFMGRGWEPVKSEDPERFGTRRLPDGVQSQVDGLRVYQDVVLLRIPVERAAELEAEKAREREAALHGPTETFMENGEQIRRAYGGAAPSDGRPLYYSRAGYGYTHTEE